jgi:hypothetical protein
MCPVKEPHFFCFDGSPPRFGGGGWDDFSDVSTDWDGYVRLFDGASGRKAIGEASATYLSCHRPEHTADNILRRLPGVRLIAILRQPALRAYSHFCHKRQRGTEPLRTFRQAIEAEDARFAGNWPIGYLYRRNGLYHANLKPYLDRFGRDRVKVFLHEDWLREPDRVLGRIFEFLEIEDRRIPGAADSHNAALLTRSGALHRWLVRPNAIKDGLKRALPAAWRRSLKGRALSWNSPRPPPLDPGLRREVTESCREDILRLQGLIGRDLSHWLRP